jgi:DNA-binding transcriptional ArsR family regulator
MTLQNPAPPPGGWPQWLDPARDIVLTPKRLRGLVHPIRVRLLRLLETEGSSTASQLGRVIGQSSGVTSYHLRILAELGFVEEDESRGNGRDRWWRPKYRSSALTFRSPDDPGDDASVEVAEQYMQLLVDQYAERMSRFVASLHERRDQLATAPWTLSEAAIQLTHDQARALSTEITALVDRYRRDPGAQPAPDAVRAVFQFQMLPDDLPPEEDPS